MKHTVKRLLGINGSGNKFICGFIADQRPFGATLNHWTSFMGIDSPYVTGGEAIGQRIDAGYLYLDVKKIKRGVYRLTFKPIIPNETDNGDFPFTHQYLRMLENSIRREPALWLWTHKRWIRTRQKQHSHPTLIQHHR